MICFLALIVFGILAIFSTTFRPLAKEAFLCVFKKIRLKPCDTGLDMRIKSSLTGKLMNKSPKLARFTYKNFQFLSWIFTLLMILSFVYAVIGGYNYYLYGNCNGPGKDGFCIFDPLGKNNEISSVEQGSTCSIEQKSPQNLRLNILNLSTFPSIERNAENTVVFIGCYACPYTRKVFPDIKRISEREDVNFVFAHIPVKDSTYFISDILNCINSINESKFMEFSELLFTDEITDIESEENVLNIVERIGFNKTEIKICMNDSKIQNITKAQVSSLEKIGIYGTPTVFINGEAVVGPKPYRVYSRMLK